MAVTVEPWVRALLADPRVQRRPAEFGRQLTARWTEELTRSMLRQPMDDGLADLSTLAAADSGSECVLPNAFQLGARDNAALHASDASSVRRKLRRIDDISRPGAPPPEPQPDFIMRLAVSALQAVTYPSGAKHAIPSDLAEAVKGSIALDIGLLDEPLVCRLAAWWARGVSLKPESEQRDDLNALSYAKAQRFALQAGEIATADGGAGWNGSAPPGYPIVAAHLGITGKTRVEVTLDEEGRPIDVRILKREVNVPGLERNESIAFKHVFDEAAISNALGKRYSSRPLGKNRRLAVEKLDFVWALED